MGSDKAQLGIGSVPIMLNGSEYVLVPSLNAAKKLSRMHGGIRGAIDAVMKMDIDVITEVVELGLGPRVASTIKDLPTLVWQSGLTDQTGRLTEHCITYLSILANGGKPIEDKGPPEPDAHDNPQSAA